MAIGRISSAKNTYANQNPVINNFSASGGTETTYESGGKTYKVHTFTSSGTLTVDFEGHADVLVVGGGGAGGTTGVSGSNGTGGGGGGGVRQVTNVYLNGGSHTITVGAGGASTQDPLSAIPHLLGRL